MFENNVNDPLYGRGFPASGNPGNQDYLPLRNKPAIDGIPLLPNSTRAELDIERASLAGNNDDLTTDEKSTLVGAISENQGKLAYLEQSFSSWTGLGGFLTSHDFGTDTPAQDDLTNYTLSQIPTITDPVDIFNGTMVTNLHDGHVWKLTNTPNTAPPVFDWADIGPEVMAPFDTGMGGYIVGADESDPLKDGYIREAGNGLGRVIGWSELKQRTLDLFCPVGERYEQHYNDPDPIERGLPGTWELWSHRADRYGLFTADLPAYTAYTSGASYAANAVVLDHLPGDDYRLFKAKAAITGAAAYLNPVLWDAVEPAQRVDRRLLQAWTEDDFTIGARIPSGDYAGMYVGEIIVPGGKFPSVEGGFRPTFLSGGTSLDTQRRIIGRFSIMAYAGATKAYMTSAYNSGPFYNNYSEKPSSFDGYTTVANSNLDSSTGFDSSRVVLTGPENSPRTVSVRIWRRVA